MMPRHPGIQDSCVWSLLFFFSFGMLLMMHLYIWLYMYIHILYTYKYYVCIYCIYIYINTYINIYNDSNHPIIMPVLWMLFIFNFKHDITHYIFIMLPYFSKLRVSETNSVPIMKRSVKNWTSLKSLKKEKRFSGIIKSLLTKTRPGHCPARL